MPIQKISSSPVLVLEDDIEVCENFYDKLDYVMKNIPQNWDLVFLGHHPYDVNEITKIKKGESPRFEKWTQERSKTRSMGGAFAYMISKKGGEKIMNYISNVGITNGNDWMMFLTPNMNNYYVFPFLVYSECLRNSNVSTIWSRSYLTSARAPMVRLNLTSGGSIHAEGSRSRVDTDIWREGIGTLELTYQEFLLIEVKYWMKKTKSKGVLSVTAMIPEDLEQDPSSSVHYGYAIGEEVKEDVVYFLERNQVRRFVD